MGANDKGVVVGNVAVMTKVTCDPLLNEKLTGMCLVRLSLERSGSSAEAVSIITDLLEKHGQGGPCAELEPTLGFHNTFVIADQSEVWLLETAGRLWAARLVKSGLMFVSNRFTIDKDFDRCSDGLKDKAKELGLWDGSEPFSFKACFTDSENAFKDREEAGKKLLSESGKHTAESFISILRNVESGICETLDRTDSVTTGAQVSVLGLPGKRSLHWFTGTPDPSVSIFKPFVFVPGVGSCAMTMSPNVENDPAKETPRFQRKVERAHPLWQAHAAAFKAGRLPSEELRELERNAVKEMAELDGASEDILADLFKDAVQSEMKFYE